MKHCGWQKRSYVFSSLNPLTNPHHILMAHATIDVFAARSRYALTRFHSETAVQNILSGQHPSESPTKLPVLPRVSENLPVCIIGAGVAGLYTAMILQDLGIPYDLLEAGNRVGGRLFTHKFKAGKEYDYFVSAIGFFYCKSLSLTRSGCWRNAFS